MQPAEGEAEEVYVVLWHTHWGDYRRTEIECDGEPSYAEATQFLSVKEDLATEKIRVDSVMESDE